MGFLMMLGVLHGRGWSCKPAISGWLQDERFLGQSFLIVNDGDTPIGPVGEHLTGDDAGGSHCGCAASMLRHCGLIVENDFAGRCLVG